MEQERYVKTEAARFLENIYMIGIPCRYNFTRLG